MPLTKAELEYLAIVPQRLKTLEQQLVRIADALERLVNKDIELSDNNQEN